MILVQGGDKLLKVRLQGTKKDIRWYMKALQRDPRYEIDYVSDFQRCKGSDKFHRMYINVFRKDKKKALNSCCR